jgi:hypothetical protein
MDEDDAVNAERGRSACRPVHPSTSETNVIVCGNQRRAECVPKNKRVRTCAQLRQCPRCCLCCSASINNRMERPSRPGCASGPTHPRMYRLAASLPVLNSAGCGTVRLARNPAHHALTAVEHTNALQASKSFPYCSIFVSSGRIMIPINCTCITPQIASKPDRPHRDAAREPCDRTQEGASILPHEERP